jgi:hypothetical protein
MLASKHSCKVLCQQNPLTIPCGRQPEELKQVKKHSPLTTSQGTWIRSNIKKACAFTEYPSENESEEEEALTQLLETSSNSNYQSTVSKELRFKKSSTA